VTVAVPLLPPCLHAAQQAFGLHVIQTAYQNVDRCGSAAKSRPVSTIVTLPSPDDDAIDPRLDLGQAQQHSLFQRLQVLLGGDVS
jgi:hypothetical protein